MSSTMSSAVKSLLFCLTAIAYCIALTLFTIIVGIHVQTAGVGDDSSDLGDPNSIASLCGPTATSEKCSVTDLLALGSIGGLIVSPLAGVALYLAIKTVTKVRRQLACADHAAASMHRKGPLSRRSR